MLLVGGIVIGLASGDDGYAKVQPIFGELFFGILTLFLTSAVAITFPFNLVAGIPVYYLAATWLG